MNTDSSPPRSSAYYTLTLPTMANQSSPLDYMFRFAITVVDDGVDNADVSFTVDANPALANTVTTASPPQPFPPTVYQFDRGDTVNVVVVQADYFIKGTLTIKSFNTDIGQFCNNRKNFFLDVTYGRDETDVHTAQGLFALTPISADS